jgi:SagB-type dehydrogenase family enzyme
MPPPDTSIDVVLDYHSRTKHYLHRFAASPGYLDWASQPDPFRTFADAKTVELPLSARRISTTPYAELDSPKAAVHTPIDADSVGALLQLALGLSAWKQFEQTRWSLRSNPSSGNLHPTEGYVIIPQLAGLDAGVYHYAPRDHQLEWRCMPDREGNRLAQILPGVLLVGLSSIHWREAWKYGERAFRYCQHDIGHAIATVRYAAAALGWKAKLLDVSDATIANLLGLARMQDFSGIDEADREHPGALMLVGRDVSFEVDIAGLTEIVNSSTWVGRANRLSPDHLRWPVIDLIAEATWRTEESLSLPASSVFESMEPIPRAASSAPRLATEIILQRRSAVALDDSTSISAQTFYGMLDRLLPRAGVAPWDVVPWHPHVHCGIFVHRVEGLAPGLYLFVRNRNSRERIRAALQPSFVFERPEKCPEHLQLFRLVSGDFRQQAQVVSCRQKIAGAGAFSVGMIAEFSESLRTFGPWWYRRLFWEAGVLGQVLYLEAEAAGVRGTGIGCYFDDAFHDILGLRDNKLQSLYHFTIGGAVEDTRLTTLPPYAHLSGRSG